MKQSLPRLAILAAALLAIPVSSSAALVVTLQPTTQTLTVGSSGFLDVFVTGTSATADPVSGYSIAIDGVSGLSYTGAVTTATAAPDGYIFPNPEGILVASTTPDLTYIDNTLTVPTNVTSGETYGAGRFFFDAIAPGTYSINFDATPGRNAFTDSGGNGFPATFTGATVTVLPAAVPEPSTTLLLGLTGLVGIVVARSRRRCPAPA